MSIVTLQQLDPIFVDFPIPEQNLSPRSKMDQEIEDHGSTAYAGRTFQGQGPLDRRAHRRQYAQL